MTRRNPTLYRTETRHPRLGPSAGWLTLWLGIVGIAVIGAIAVMLVVWSTL